LLLWAEVEELDPHLACLQIVHGIVRGIVRKIVRVDRL
jgi:hypothetical protein